MNDIKPELVSNLAAELFKVNTGVHSEEEDQS
jgi:hypothetical protein